MRRMRLGTVASLAAVVAAGGSVLAGCTSADSAAAKVDPTTPAGITLVEVVKDRGGGQPVFLWIRPGDSDGRTLFVSDKDGASRSNCTAGCAQEFRPLEAERGARAFGDWSIIARTDGKRQWAYQARPLYTWTREKVPGEVATNVGVAATGGNPDVAPHLDGKGQMVKPPPPLMPPAGWQVARFTPAASLSRPDGIRAREIPSALAVALVDASGMTLYAFDGDVRRDGQDCTASQCQARWLPLPAATLALSVGNFSIATRLDGSRQWTYRGRPLYTYAGDKLPGDVHGAGVDPHWSVAAVSRDFRPDRVAITNLDGYGDVVSVDGMTLYGGYPFEHRIGGRNQRGDFTYSAYNKGKALGPAACVDAGCLKSWRPFAAPADARPDGWWEPITRPDGTRQWAYKGYALYTYAEDKAPGDHSGQATYDFQSPGGDYQNFQRTMFFVKLAKVLAGPGIYWNIAKP